MALQKFALVQFINGSRNLGSTMNLEKKGTMLTGMKKRKQLAIIGDVSNATYNMSKECSAGYK
jgi:hypothetical protein